MNKHYFHKDFISILPNQFTHDKIIQLLRKHKIPHEVGRRGKITIPDNSVEEVTKILRNNDIGVFLKAFDPFKTKALKQCDMNEIDLSKMSYEAKIRVFKRLYTKVYNEPTENIPEYNSIDKDIEELKQKLNSQTFKHM